MASVVIAESASAETATPVLLLIMITVASASIPPSSATFIYTTYHFTGAISSSLPGIAATVQSENDGWGKDGKEAGFYEV